MRFHLAGVIVFVLILLLAVVAGAVPAFAIVRVALVVYVVATFVEIVANMVRHRDLHVRSRLLGLLFESTFSPWHGSFAPWVRWPRR